LRQQFRTGTGPATMQLATRVPCRRQVRQGY
jgi:hypothetical protein